jgi:predicted glycosyltransferase
MPAVGAPAAETDAAMSRRLCFYSPDTLGLGHIRTNLALAAAAAEVSPPPITLLITGARAAAGFSLPRSTDLLVLPGIEKCTDGRYTARSLGTTLEDTVKLRSGIIEAAVDSFAPDVLVVDRVPGGAFGEIEPALQRMRQRAARCVFGLRDIIDTSDRTVEEWQRLRFDSLLTAFYDAIYVYGDRSVYDVATEYRLNTQVADKLVYTGYLCSPPANPTPPRDSISRALELPPGPIALCVLGGGQDGHDLAQLFLEARLPQEAFGVLVVGPYMPASEVRELRAQLLRRPQFRCVEFVPNLSDWMAVADAIVCMGGYQTICDVLSTGNPALVVPRHRPREEQLLRASRFRDLGALDMLHPEHASAEALSSWLISVLARRSHPRSLNAPHFANSGLTRAATLLARA